MPGNSSSSSSSMREALADASAGVAGSLVAMLTFYPIDVIKTNLQASTQQHQQQQQQQRSTNRQQQQTQQQQVQEWTAYSFYRFLRSFLRGLHYKTAHTVASSFTYFFIYSFIAVINGKSFPLSFFFILFQEPFFKMDRIQL